MSATQSLARAFTTGVTLNSTQITQLFGLRNPAEAVRTLRSQGYCIYTNKNGYRLGTPTKRMVALANLVAGSQIFNR